MLRPDQFVKVMVIISVTRFDSFDVIVPSWNPKQKFTIRYEDIPKDLCPLVSPGKRLHAKANIGAERLQDVRFKDWGR